MFIISKINNFLKSSELEQYTLISYLIFVSTIIFNVIFSNFLLIFKLELYRITFLSAFLLTIFFLYFKKFKNFYISLIIFLIIFSISYFCSYYIYSIDFNADSNSSHIKLLYAIYYGWNPFFEWGIENNLINTINSVLAFKGFQVGIVSFLKFLNNASELRGSSTFSIIFFAYSILFGLILIKQLKEQKILIFFLIILNPISVGIVGTNYYDIYLSSGLLTLFYFFKRVIEEKKFSLFNFLSILMTSLLIASTKLNSFFFINFLIFVYFIYLIYVFEIKDRYKLFLSYFIYAILILIINFNPIGFKLKNISNFSNFESQVGHDASFLWTEKRDYLKNTNRFQILFDSIFSQTNINPDYHPTTTKKLEKIIDESEILTLLRYKSTDIRAGAYGPLFGYSLVLILILLILNINKIKWRENRNELIFIFATVFTLAIIRYPVFARHIPNFYILIIIILFLLSKILKPGRISRFINYTFIIIISLNFLIFSFTTIVRNISEFNKIQTEKKLINYLKEQNYEMIVYPENREGILIQHSIYNKKKYPLVSEEKFNKDCLFSYVFNSDYVKICIIAKSNKNMLDIRKKINFYCKMFSQKMYLIEIKGKKLNHRKYFIYRNNSKDTFPCDEDFNINKDSI